MRKTLAVVLFIILLTLILSMAIKHTAVKVSGNKGYASEWNADHTIEDSSAAKRSVTLIVAASDSNDTNKADYVCDGVADQAEINTAIGALPAAGGVIKMLDGTYNLGQPILITRDNVDLVGNGMGTIINGPINNYKIHVDGSAARRSGILIAHLKIIGNAGGAFDEGIRLRDCDDCGIISVHIEDCAAKAIFLYHNKRTTVISSRMVSNTGNGLQATGDGTNPGNLVISGNVVQGNSYGIYLDNEDQVIVTDNQVLENTKHGIYLSGTENSLISNNVARDNDVADSASFDGISLVASSYCVVVGNRCYNNDRYEINVADAGCDYTIVLGNDCHGTDHVGAINDAGDFTESAHNIVA